MTYDVSQPTYGIVIYANVDRPTPTDRLDVTWDDLVGMLVDTHREAACEHNPASPRLCIGRLCPEKAAGAWSPVTLKEGTSRKDVNVETVNLLVLDLDHLPNDDATAAVLDRIEGAGLQFLTHTTHNHKLDDQCIRVVIPLSRPVPAAAWPAFYARAVQALGIPTDPTCKDRSRQYFLPSHPADDEAWGASETTGDPLDVDLFLSPAPASPGPLPVPSFASPVVPPSPAIRTVDTALEGSKLPPSLLPEDEVVVDMLALERALKRRRNLYRSRGDTTRQGLLDRILDGKTIALPGARDATIHQAACILATTYPTKTPVEAAVEVLRPSIASMETAPEGLDYWLAHARDSYERSMADRVVREAARDKVNAQIATGLRGLMQSIADAKTRKEDAEEAGEAPPTEEEDPEAWYSELIIKPVKDASEEPKLVDCEHNAVTLLTHLPEWAGRIRWNDLTKDIECTGAPIPESDHHTSVLPTACAAWLHRHYALKLNARHVEGPLLLVAKRLTYDPLVEYLDGLRWDGVPRIDTLLIDYAEAVTVDIAGADISEHVKRVTRKWLLGAAVRALRPGLQVDSVLVLEGTMGSGKTAFFRTLAGDYYATLQKELDSKDTALVAARSWIIEMGELASVRKADRESNNNALTITHDVIRPPYGRSVERFPRRCVFGATTEDDDWLTSRKGSRRWWPVKVGNVDLSGLYSIRDQVWAEAAVLAREAIEEIDRVGGDTRKLPERLRWWLSGEDEKQAHRIAGERLESTGIEEAIIAWWKSLEPSKRPLRVTATQVIHDALGGGDMTRTKASLIKDVSQALLDLGFRKGSRERVGDSRIYPYHSTEELRAMPRERSGANMVAALKALGGVG